MLSIQCQKGSYFQKLCVANGNIIQFILFVSAFYAFESLLFYTHCNHENNLIIIPSVMRTRQGDPLGAALFALTHFKALRSLNHFPSFIFPSITNDIHIIGPLSIISFTYKHFQTKLHAIGLFIHP